MQDFRSEGYGAPHRRCRASAGISLDRGLAKAGSRHGTRNMCVGYAQFALDILVQRFYYVRPAKFVAGPHYKNPRCSR
jgi:hypothetical protein